MKKILISFGVLLVLALGFWLIYNFGISSPKSSNNNSNFSDLIQVDAPSANAIVKSPLEVSGKARGNWYFEASFPVRLFDGNGKEIARAPAQAQGDWMTTDLVPFKAVLEFSQPTTPTGTLVLANDNPSGLPENAKEIRIPVSFSLKQVTKQCVVTGCSHEICSSQQVTSACIYQPQFACYQSAKCEVQTNGECGWTATPEFLSCLDQKTK